LKPFAVSFVNIRKRLHMTNDRINLTLLARLIQARLNSLKNHNEEWVEKHTVYINEILKALPHGSGIDAGMHIDFDRSTETRIIFKFSWHHMDEYGYYDGWTDNELIITPTFGDKDLLIRGQRLKNIKDLLYQIFDHVFYIADPQETQNDHIQLHKTITAQA
jgi:hypothetical protein